MNSLVKAFSTAAILIFGVSGAALADEYIVEANRTKKITLNLCSSNVAVTVDGDGDTDLDFRIADKNGRIVHSDLDYTDFTFARIRKNSGCEPYTLYVINNGDVYNRFNVDLRNDQSVSSR